MSEEILEQELDSADSDRMTVAEMAEGLKQLLFSAQAFERFDAKEREVLTAAINYLSIEPCQDCVSTNRVINAVLGDASVPSNIAAIVRQDIEKLPPARLLRRGGRWIREKGDCSSKCPICSEFSNTQSKFCPNCGAELNPSSKK